MGPPSGAELRFVLLRLKRIATGQLTWKATSSAESNPEATTGSEVSA